jgi:SAM-dependent methyltransferase
MNVSTYDYKGGELELFQGATNWKRYLASQVKPFVGARVAEVGAGIGANTPFLCSSAAEWLCIEPDPLFAGCIERRKVGGDLCPQCKIVNAKLADLPLRANFDTILYVDVIEHIEDDRAEVAEAAARLRRRGYLVILSPAHQWLFTPFDAAIGHYRRYTRKTLADLNPPGLRLVLFKYLDSVGMLASAANRFFLRTAHPTRAQVRFWDRLMVPTSRWTDPLTNFSVGKSILVVWQAP